MSVSHTEQRWYFVEEAIDHCNWLNLSLTSSERHWLKNLTVCQDFLQMEKCTTCLIRTYLRRSLCLCTQYSWGSCSPGWYHIRAGTTEDLDRRNWYAQKGINHPIYYSCFPHHLSPCLWVWDMLNITRRDGIWREGEQLCSKMRICMQASAFSVASDQLPKLCVDLKYNNFYIIPSSSLFAWGKNQLS